MDASIIKQLIDMDRAARQIVEEAEAEKQKSDKLIAEEKARVEQEIMERAKRRIETMKSQNVDEANKEAISIEEEGRRLMAGLQNNYDENHEKWENAIYERVVSIQ